MDGVCAALSPIYCQTQLYIFNMCFFLTRPALLLQATRLSHSHLTYILQDIAESHALCQTHKLS